MITDEEKAELAKILGQNFTPAPTTIAAAPEIGVPDPDTGTPASAMDETLSMSEISNGSVPEMAAVERINGHIPELPQNQPDVSSLENGETPSTQPETGCQIEEEVVSGVVYIRLNSHVTTEPEIVPEISDSQQIVPETSDTVSEIAEKVPEIETVEVIIIEEQPPGKTVKKRKKKTSTGIIRNRESKTKEVQTIQNIEQKLKGFE